MATTEASFVLKRMLPPVHTPVPGVIVVSCASSTAWNMGRSVPHESDRRHDAGLPNHLIFEQRMRLACGRFLEVFARARQHFLSFCCPSSFFFMSIWRLPTPHTTRSMGSRPHYARRPCASTSDLLCTHSVRWSISLCALRHTVQTALCLQYWISNQLRIASHARFARVAFQEQR